LHIEKFFLQPQDKLLCSLLNTRAGVEDQNSSLLKFLFLPVRVSSIFPQLQEILLLQIVRLLEYYVLANSESVLLPAPHLTPYISFSNLSIDFCTPLPTASQSFCIASR